MRRIRDLILDKIRSILITVVLVVVALQTVILPVTFDLLTTLPLLILVWWCAKLDSKRSLARKSKEGL